MSWESETKCVFSPDKLLLHHFPHFGGAGTACIAAPGSTHGTSSQTEEYVGTTCYDTCNDPNYPTLCDELEGGSGGGGSEPHLEQGDDEASISTSDIPPNEDGSPGNINTPPISTIYRAHVAWEYDHTDMKFDYITPYKPYPIPVSQVFLDDNGNQAVFHVSIGPWTSTITALTIKTCYVQWTFDALKTYVFTTGTRGPFTFVYTTGRVIGPN